MRGIIGGAPQEEHHHHQVSHIAVYDCRRTVSVDFFCFWIARVFCVDAPPPFTLFLSFFLNFLVFYRTWESSKEAGGCRVRIYQTVRDVYFFSFQSYTIHTAKGAAAIAAASSQQQLGSRHRENKRATQRRERNGLFNGNKKVSDSYWISL